VENPKHNKDSENMKNKLRFAGFLISRFKGLIIYAIGLGFFFYFVVQTLIVPLVVPAHEINDSINIYVSVVGLVLMMAGQLIRCNQKMLKNRPLLEYVKNPKRHLETLSA